MKERIMIKLLEDIKREKLAAKTSPKPKPNSKQA